MVRTTLIQLTFTSQRSLPCSFPCTPRALLCQRVFGLAHMLAQRGQKGRQRSRAHGVLLPDDEALLDLAPDLLRKGYNILIFPEATRSPSPHDLRPFRRGAAQLAIRAQAPLVPITISVNRQILAKGQPPTEMGTQTVHYNITIAPPLHPPRCPAAQTRQKANLLTHQSQTCITRLLESAR